MLGVTMAENPYASPHAEVAPVASDAPALWNPHAAGNWNLLFTPVFGSFLIWKNWQAIGERTRGRAWFIISVVVLLPSIVAPGLAFLYLIIWYFSSVKRQARLVHERWGTAYPRRAWRKPLLVGLGAWVVLVVLAGTFVAVFAP